MKINDSHIGRRNFLCGMIGGGAAAMTAGAAVPVAYFTVNPRVEPLPDFVEYERADWERAVKEFKYLDFGRIKVLLIQPPGTDSREELKVFDATCTHAECEVGYLADENRIYCGCHKAYYDIDGQVLSGPPPRPLRQFHYKFVGETLVIALEKENLEQASGETEA